MKNTILGLFIAACFTFIGSGASATAQETSAKDTTITVKVAGVTCGGDLPTICKYVEKESGILEIKSVGKVAAVSTFEVKYDPAKISFEQVVAKIEDSPSCDAPKKKPFRVKK
jgi:copper chaperone CopZ